MTADPQIASLFELETHYSWLDYCHANEALDIRLEAEAEAMKGKPKW